MIARTQSALDCGALQSIATLTDYLEQEGLTFLVRLSANLARKQAQASMPTRSSPQRPSRNPFLPYETELHVADLSPTHVALLNKFNVVDHHLLIITRDFESQETWLTEADFFALAMAMSEVEGLGFYNGGPIAGASQRHKHLQLVPLPFTTTGDPLPLQILIRDLKPSDRLQHLSQLPFRHGLICLNLDWTQAPEQLATLLLAPYQSLCLSLGLQDPHQPMKPGAYNLLVTRDWMFMVPRRRESYASISVNALGFAGSLFIRDATQLEQLKAIGPLQLLQQVACPL